MGRNVYHYGGEPKRLTAEQVAALAYQAGWRGDDIVKATAIAKRESGYRYNVHASDRPQSDYSGDLGLFQINYVNFQTLKNAGIIKDQRDLFDPLVNAKAAYHLYQRSNNTFAPWTAGPGGWTAGGDPLYGTNVTEARQAVTSAASKGLFGSNITLASLGISANPVNWLPGMPGLPDVPNPLDLLPGAGAVGDVASLIAQIYRTVFSARFWLRVLQVIAGAVLIMFGLRTLAMPVIDQQLNKVTGAVTSATPAGAAVQAAT